MKANDRRKEIISILQNQTEPLSASKLAAIFSVSRQIVVGDIALLRAEEHKIIATSRGYILVENLVDGGFIGKIVCNHSPSQTREELYTIVDLGGHILDTSVQHELYGELVGQLNIASRLEVDLFMKMCEQMNAKLLTELTGGLHTHSIFAKDAKTFALIKQALETKGLLYTEE